MFIRRVKNISGNTSVQVVKKEKRKNIVVKHIGTGRTQLEVIHLTSLAQEFIDNQRINSGILSLFDTRYERSEFDELLSQFTFTHALDTLTYRFFSHFYDKLGFSTVQDFRFKDLVIARIVDPVSKRKTRDVLEYRFGKQYALTTLYRTLRTACKLRYQEKIENVIKQFIKSELGLKISVLFFDVTTLYYEAFDEDDTRKFGFSKDLKFNQPQIIVALTVTTQGIPLAMRMFAGDTFEGHTMLPVIGEVKKRFGLQQIVVVADAAMLNRDNLKDLEGKKIKYIVGARLGNVTDTLFEKIVTKLSKKDGSTRRIPIADNRILVVSYSAKRAKKDKFDREKQVQKAKDMLAKPASLVRRYKFIARAESETYQLNEALIDKAEKLEGIKGYITNATSLTNKAIIEKYTDLWTVEKAFRMSKSDLKARPIFHTVKESIEAHLLIVFTALIISRYVEMISQRSIARVVNILRMVKEIIVEDNVSKQRASKYTNFTEEAKELVKLANIDWVT